MQIAPTTSRAISDPAPRALAPRMLMLAALLVLAMTVSWAAAGRAQAAFGDGFGIAAAQGPALPGPSSLWAGTCDLAAAPAPEAPIVGGIGSRPASIVIKDGIYVPPPIDQWFGRVEATIPAIPQSCIDGRLPSSWRLPPATRAAIHPDATVTFTLNPLDASVSDYADGNPKEITVALPPGIMGNPEATPRCSLIQFALQRCPVASQVGVIDLRITLTANTVPRCGGLTCVVPLFNIAPIAGQTAALGFTIPGQGTTVLMSASVRTESDYGLNVDLTDIPEYPALVSSAVTLWGVPGDPVHDAQRGVQVPSSPPNPDQAVAPQPWPKDIPIKPFFTNPTACDGSRPVTTMHISSWQHPDDVQTYTTDAPPVTNCAAVPFDPSLALKPTESSGRAPTGMGVDLVVPQDDPSGLATSYLKKAVVRLPKGMSISPSSADGLGACSDAQIALHTNKPVACPDASKIGTVKVDTPVLDDPLHGGIYLGTQESNDPASGKMFRLFLEIKSPERGLLIKLPGQIRVDPGTGQITAVFDDNPQVPFSKMHLEFNAGPRAPVSLPARCGTYTTVSTLTGWSGKTVTSKSSFTVDHCPNGGFKPTATAGTLSPTAGDFSPFVMSFGRDDAQQPLGAIHASLPGGLLGILKSVPMCPAAQGAAGSCPASSLIGSVQATAGPGSNPITVPGRVYLTKPYRSGDIAGMSVVVPAKAGPFDLGDVVTRVFVRLRPRDQGIDVASDPLPTIVGGVPLQVRKVQVLIDRKGFMFNPTSCEKTKVFMTLFSSSWVKSQVNAPFQARDCASLPLSPIVRVNGGGRGRTARYEHPALRVRIWQSWKEANLDRTNVVLPKALNVDLKAPSLKGSCTRADYAKDQCPAVATVGTVRAVTPALAEPLTGPAFLRRRPGELPDIIMRLRNSQMQLDLVGRLDFLKNGRLITRVRNIPDAPITSFELKIKGGKNGSLLNRKDLCKRRATTRVRFTGHNGKASVKTPVTHYAGCKAVNAHRSRARSHTAAARARTAARRARHHGGR